MTPAAKREAAAHLCNVHGVSQRRACRAIGVDRALVRYQSRRPDDKAVRTRLRELAAVRRRFGWRRLQVLLSREGVHMNHKKLRRLYIEERLQVRSADRTQAGCSDAGSADGGASPEPALVDGLRPRRAE